MNVIKTRIPEICIIEPRIFTDDRGYFYESFNLGKFSAAIGREVNFIQDNHSHSKQHTLRGLHYQMENPQDKLVRVVQGRVFDVAVDIRKSSPTFGQWVGVELSAENQRQLWVPAGFAHGFLVLSDTADFLYKVNHYWSPHSERRIIWNDPAIGIEWPVTDEPVLSPKDAAGVVLAQAETFA